MKKRIVAIFSALILGLSVFASEEHEHEHAEGGSEESEMSAGVGPDKGILEASAETGFRLSPEAIRNFEIKTVKLAGAPPWPVPSGARMFSGDEINLYRVRDGRFKRIDFKQVKTSGGTLSVQSADLTTGDEVVVHGVPLLRLAELAAFGGASEGHSH